VQSHPAHRFRKGQRGFESWTKPGAVALHLLWMRILEAHIPLYVAIALSLLIGPSSSRG